MPKREVTSAPWAPVPARACTGKAPRARQHRAVGRGEIQGSCTFPDKVLLDYSRGVSLVERTRKTTTTVPCSGPGVHQGGLVKHPLLVHLRPLQLEHRVNL